MEPPAGSLEPLEYIRQYLRAEGFYAAEEALVSEIENRCPEGSSPTSSTQDLHRAALAGEYHQRNPPFAKGISEQQPRQDSRSLPGYCFRSSSQTSYLTLAMRRTTPVFGATLLYREPDSWRDSDHDGGSYEDSGNIEELYNHLQEGQQRKSRAPNIWKRATLLLLLQCSSAHHPQNRHSRLSSVYRPNLCYLQKIGTSQRS